MSKQRIEVHYGRTGRQRNYTLVVDDSTGRHAEVSLTKADAAMLLRVVSDMLGNEVHSKYRIKEESST